MRVLIDPIKEGNGGRPKHEVNNLVNGSKLEL